MTQNTYTENQVAAEMYGEGTEALEVLDKYLSIQNTFFHINEGMLSEEKCYSQHNTSVYLLSLKE